MATQIIMPQLGMGMLEGTIVHWIVADGATVTKRQELVEIQTEKIIQTLDAPKDGTLQQVAREGDRVPVREVIAYLLAAGESRVGPAAAAVAVPTAGPAPVSAPATGEVRASPIARRLAKEHGLELSTLTGTGPGGRVGETDVLAAVAARHTAPSEPPAAPVEATRIEVERATASAPPEAPAPAVPPAADSVPVSGIRQVIFERMAHSAQTVARVTEFTEVDATALVEIRARLKDELQKTDNLPVTYNDLLIAIAARALREHRLLNSTYVDGEIRLRPEIHIGLAVDTQRGLLVPVVHNAGALHVADIAREVRRLVERAQAGKSLPEDFAGGTFTITNIGAFEVDGFTPIVNLPECAILGVGRIVPKPAVYQGEIAIRQMMVLSLSFDHRLVDGAPAARFLQRIKQLIEQPYLLL
jgi:pyruvate dehydrogenase E2 component (dihydrolipoamide acetyltransferase)